MNFSLSNDEFAEGFDRSGTFACRSETPKKKVIKKLIVGENSVTKCTDA